uniref:Uncharacterized protein n=1 Tax=Rhizophora mucronata TaxID=61149 RepID=A0A2P2M597_RHIMU
MNLTISEKLPFLESECNEENYLHPSKHQSFVNQKLLIHHNEPKHKQHWQGMKSTVIQHYRNAVGHQVPENSR